MLLMIAVILGFGAIRIATGAIQWCVNCDDFYVMQLSMPLMNLSTLVTDYKKQLVQVVESLKSCKNLLNQWKIYNL